MTFEVKQTLILVDETSCEPVTDPPTGMAVHIFSASQSASRVALIEQAQEILAAALEKIQGE